MARLSLQNEKRDVCKKKSILKCKKKYILKKADPTGKWKPEKLQAKADTEELCVADRLLRSNDGKQNPGLSLKLPTTLNMFRFKPL